MIKEPYKIEWSTLSRELRIKKYVKLNNMTVSLPTPSCYSIPLIKLPNMISLTLIISEIRDHLHVLINCVKLGTLGRRVVRNIQV